MQITNPYGWSLILTALITAALVPAVWQRRKAPGVLPVVAILGGATIWSLAYGVQLFCARLNDILFWTKIVYIGVVSVSSGLFVFALQFSGLESRMPRRYPLLLAVEPVIILLLAWTNELHYLFQKDVVLVTFQGFVFISSAARGPVFWIHILYTYLLLIIAAVILVWAAIRSPQIYRGQVGSMLVAVSLPWVGNIIHLLVRPLPIDPTPLAFAGTGLAVTFGIYRFRLFNMIPVARALVLESISDAVLVVDDLNRPVDANPAARSLLVPAGGDLNRQPGKAIFAPWWEQISPYLNDDAASGEVNLNSAGKPHWFALRVSIIRRRANGHLTGRVLVFHDIQDRKEAEERLAAARDQALQASMTKSQLVANVSHDLRTPINATLGYADMLLERNGAELKPHQVEIIEQMHSAARQMNLFVSDLLDQALIEQGQMSLHPVRFRPAELVSGVQVIFRRAALEKGLLLTFEIEPELPEMLWGDVKRLQQVLMNLVGNAIKFTAQGSVTVRMYTAGVNWVIEVSDTGCGIPAEAHAYIFEPFRQVEDSPGRAAYTNNGGAGLGLAIVKELVTMMDGGIELSSQMNRGSTFRVVLPIQK